MERQPFVSIIIPTWRDSKILNQCLDSLLAQDYPKDKFEIILLSKEELAIKEHEQIRTIYIDKDINYGQARNIGVENARGDLLAFIDDDCVTPNNWLRKAVKYFQDESLALLGGPAIPFQNEVINYKVGGYLLSSPFVVGVARFRYKSFPRSFETRGDHLILANNFLRKQAFKTVLGFHIDQVPCEDGYLYFRLKKRGYKLLYTPEIFVWHRAKPLFLPMASRFFYYAVGRGGLMARDCRTIRLIYLIPTLFTLGLTALLILSLIFKEFFYLLLIFLSIYLLSNFVNALYLFLKSGKKPLVLLLSFLAAPLIHLSYGFGFLFGVYKYLSGGFKGGVKMGNKY